MSSTLSPDDPNLIIATNRLSRTLRVWAALFAGAGVLTIIASQGRQPIIALQWIIIAFILAVGKQPVYLALASIQWGLSLTLLIPSLSWILGPDPLSYLIYDSSIENIALGLVRVVLMIVAWNQFLFYRMLYGTAEASGLDADLPPIPEVIPNRTDRIAEVSRFLGLFGVVASIAAFSLQTHNLALPALRLSFTGAIFALGLGLGVAFSPTQRRSAALTSVGLGVATFLITILTSRVLSG